MTPILLSVALKGLIVLAAAFGLLAVLRGAPPALRHGVWTAAFAALLVVPLLDAFGPALTLPVLPAPSAQAQRIDHVVANEMIIADVPLGHIPDGGMILHETEIEALPGGVQVRVREGRVAAAVPRAGIGRVTRPASPVSDLPIGWILLGVWALGAVAVLMRWLAAYASAAFVVRGAREVTDDGWLDGAERARRLLGLDREVRLLVSDRLDVPVAWGFGAPAVVLPPDADGWDEDRRDAVLLHELAHVRRADARTQIVAQLALALHWPNPLAWLAYRNFLVEREHACDDAVLSGGATPSAYAGHLVDIARAARREPHTLAALAPMARRSDLERRVVSVLDAGRRRVAAGRSTLVRAVVLGLCVAAPLGLLRPVAAASDAVRTAVTPSADATVASGDAEASAESSLGMAAVTDNGLDSPDPSTVSARPASDQATLPEALQDTIPLAEDVLGPARQTTIARVRQMRADGLGLDDDAWDEIEREVQDAFDDAHDDYDGIVQAAIDQAMADENGTVYGVMGWQRGTQRLRRGDAERQAALRQAGVEREQALSEASRERDRAHQHADRERAQAQRDADHARRHALRDAERVREQALREAERVRERGRRQAERARGGNATSARSTASRSGTTSGYAYSTSSHGASASTSISSGVGAWMERLDDLDNAIRGVEHAADDLERRGKATPSALAGLKGGLAGIEGALSGIASAGAWARSDAERAIVRNRLEATRSRLRSAHRRVDACDTD